MGLFQRGSETCILQNGFMSDAFNLRRGCRQGDRISPYLFILYAEILGKMVRQNRDIKRLTINGTEYKLSQYADDTQLILDGTEKSLKAALNSLKDYLSHLFHGFRKEHFYQISLGNMLYFHNLL